MTSIRLNIYYSFHFVLVLFLSEFFYYFGLKKLSGDKFCVKENMSVLRVGLWSKSYKMMEKISQKIPFVHFLELIPEVMAVNQKLFCGSPTKGFFWKDNPDAGAGAFTPDEIAQCQNPKGEFKDTFYNCCWECADRNGKEFKGLQYFFKSLAELYLGNAFQIFKMTEVHAFLNIDNLEALNRAFFNGNKFCIYMVVVYPSCQIKQIKNFSPVRLLNIEVPLLQEKNYANFKKMIVYMITQAKSDEEKVQTRKNFEDIRSKLKKKFGEKVVIVREEPLEYDQVLDIIVAHTPEVSSTKKFFN